MFHRLENTIPQGIDTSTYEKDGLIYCGNCNTPLQTVVTIMGKEMILPVLCKCGEEQERIKKAEKLEKERLERVRELKKRHNWGKISINDFWELMAQPRPQSFTQIR